MTKSELIEILSEAYPQLSTRDIERIVHTLFNEIVVALARGDRVELRGFGAFGVKKRDARVGRNPKTGDAVEIEQKLVSFFKTGKELRARINAKNP